MRGKRKRKRNGEDGKAERVDKYLRSVYFNPKHPAAFRGQQALRRAVKEDGKEGDIRAVDIGRWLANQEAFSLYKPVRRAFRRSRVVVTGMHDQYEADLADVQKFARSNDGVRFLLVVIDVFSRMLWVAGLRSKREEDVIAGFREVFGRGQPPKRMRTDRGKEFTGRKVQAFLKEQGIEHWWANNDEMKANYAERVIRTLKKSLYGYMRSGQNSDPDRYIDVLQDVVGGYNGTQHRGTGMAPADVTAGEVERALWWHQYRPKVGYARSAAQARSRYVYKTGDHVRISHKAQVFERSHDEKWTVEVFQVVHRRRELGVKKYKLKDLLGEDIQGTFYEAELQGVDYSEDTLFDVEKILRRRKGEGGRREVLVKWRGWPDKFNSWIGEGQLKDKKG